LSGFFWVRRSLKCWLRKKEASLFSCNTCSYIHMFRWMSHLSHLNLNQDISFPKVGEKTLLIWKWHNHRGWDFERDFCENNPKIFCRYKLDSFLGELWLILLLYPIFSGPVETCSWAVSLWSFVTSRHLSLNVRTG
jgi:hypothetical protein